MQLQPDQTQRFYHIWFPLLRYVNEQRQLTTTYPDTPEEGSITQNDALLLRNALWADDELRKKFIAENPAGLSPADLAVVASWQHRLAGQFFIVRHLKKYTVFLSQNPTHAYGVLGLVSPIEEVVGSTIPIYVQAVLLPFEGRIIYDSLLMPYRVYFGPGIRGDLNDTYRNIQEREGIITTLEPSNVPANLNEVRNEVLARNAKILSAFRRDMARSGLSQKMIEQHAGTIDAFAQTYLLGQEPPKGLLETRIDDVKAYFHSAGNKINTVSFKRFVRFLFETGRMDYEQAEPLRDFLRHAGV